MDSGMTYLLIAVVIILLLVVVFMYERHHSKTEKFGNWDLFSSGIFPVAQQGKCVVCTDNNGYRVLPDPCGFGVDHGAYPTVCDFPMARTRGVLCPKPTPSPCPSPDAMLAAKVRSPCEGMTPSPSGQKGVSTCGTRYYCTEDSLYRNLNRLN